MPCGACAKKRKAMEKMAKISVHYKGTSSLDAIEPKLKIHGRLPVFCQKTNHTCLNSVYDQCCVVKNSNPCDVSECVFNTPRFEEIVQEYEKNMRGEK